LSSLTALGLYFFCKRKSTGNFIIASYLFYSIITDFIVTPLLTGITKDQGVGLRLFTVLEFFFFGIFIIFNSKKKIFNVFICCLLFVEVLISGLDYHLNPTNQFDSIPSGSAALFAISLCIIVLFRLITQATTVFLYERPIFWFVSGILIFYSGTLFLFLLSKKNLYSPSFTNTFIIINSSFSILRNILFSIAFSINNPAESNKSQIHKI
jgi:hypothetical protein